MNDNRHDDLPLVTELPSRQRRVLGVLIEKGFTTPEYYPLTLKAVTTGCNQKSNRSPVVNFSEDDVLDILDQLRELGLAAVVHTETGRTERFRHYMRKRFPFTEPQFAILTELMLRGRQQLGELRSRVSRMVAIESLNDLRQELQSLLDQNFVQASGALERRGIEVDHNFYTEREDKRQAPLTATPAIAVKKEVAKEETVKENIVTENTTPATIAPNHSDSALTQRITTLEQELHDLRNDFRELNDSFNTLQEESQQFTEQLNTLRHDLGG